MKILILGGGFYGCHLAIALKNSGVDVALWESRDDIMLGASGNIPARLHLGPHYPRSRATRASCQTHAAEFIAAYGFLTRGVPVNIYAIAADHSLVDFEQYVATLRKEIDLVEIYDPSEFGLENVEGAILTGERHILTDLARGYFRSELAGIIQTGMPTAQPSDEFDWIIDATFCANDAAGVDRYEPCLVPLVAGPCDKAVTIMDGPFGSLYPWNAERGLCSLSSAKWTPLSKDCKTYEHASAIIAGTTGAEIHHRSELMREDMARYYPAVSAMPFIEFRTSIRAMPLSGADTRLVNVRVGGKVIGIRAGKIDAIMQAEREIFGIVGL